MDLLSVLGLSAADLAHGVLDLSGLQVAAAALVTLVAPCGDAAVWADALYVPVGQESVAHRAVGQLDLFGVDVAFLHQGFHNLLSPVVTFRIVCVAEEVELHVHTLEDLVEVGVVLGHQLLWRGTLSLGVDNNWRSMGIGAADEKDVLAHLSHASYEDVRWYVGS